MHECAKYLLKKLKDLDAKRIVFKNVLIDKDGHKFWDYIDGDKFPPNCSKNMLVGFENIYSWAPNWFFASNDGQKSQNAMYFTGLWFSKDRLHSSWIMTIDEVLNNDALLDILDNVFLQLMASTYNHDIYTRDMILFKKDHGYEYMVDIDLMSEN